MLITKIARQRFVLKSMRIKLYVDGVLKEECVEEGFVILVKTKNTSFVNIFSDKKDIACPYYEKEYLFPNGNLYTLRVSTSPVFQKAAEIMKQFKGLNYVEICAENAMLQIDY